MTAERLFATRGITAVPLRDIGIGAGQKNHAVVQYHFGDRESLVREMIAFRATLSERLRVEMFADLVSRGQPQVSDLVAQLRACRWPARPGTAQPAHRAFDVALYHRAWRVSLGLESMPPAVGHGDAALRSGCL